MSEIFLKVVNMSISASYLVLAVLVLRLLFQKAPKWITVLLWGIVAVRLICPFTVESVMSLIPSAETISPQVLTTTPEIKTGISFLNQAINPVIQETTVNLAPEKSMNILHLLVLVFSKVWIVGVFAMLLYTAISYLRVKGKIGTAVLLRDNIYQSENVVSPFVLGVVRPRIYLPFGMDAGNLEHVVAHEAAHIRRKDHLWKPFGFLLLAIHWFNPLMWLGYVLLCRDIELACDEKVVKDLSLAEKADYSQALLTCSVNRRVITACPLAFGEVGVKNRVKSVLNYKKPAFWIIALALVVSAVVAVCFLTDPKEDLDSGILSQKSGSDIKGVTLKIVDADLSAPDPFFEVEWVNGTESGIEFGEKFIVLFEQDGTWENCSIEENPVWNLVAYYLEANSRIEHRTYKLNGQLMSMPGKYRLEVPIRLKGESELEHKVWVEFELEKGVASLVPHTFKAEALVYDDGMYSFVQSAEAAPDFMIANGMQLYQIVDGTVSKSLGIFQEIELDKERFDSRFRLGVECWLEEETIASIKKNNHRAWQLYGDSRDETPYLYVLLEQKDGSFYLGQGYFNCDSVSHANSDDSHIRWLYRLQENAGSIGGADAPSEVTETVDGYPFFYATVLEFYDGSILVEASKDTKLIQAGSRYFVSTKVKNPEIPVPEVEVGTSIVIVFSGDIQATYPAQINWVYAIYDATQAPAAISPLDPMVGALVLQVPTMVVVSNEQSILAQKGTSTWTYTDEKGKAVTVSADGTHPLNAKKTMPKIDIFPSYFSYGDPLGAYLGFNAEESDPSAQIKPDEIHIRCWEEKDWGKSGAAGEEIPLNVVEGNLFFALKDGNYVYEVTSTWESNGKYGGTASYTFYTEKTDFHWESYPKIGENSKVRETFLQTETEKISETYEKEEFVITKTHHQMDDGLWVRIGYGYLYRLEITGKMHGAEKNTTYIVLSNRKDLTFDQVWKADGFSSNTEDYFKPYEAVIVGKRIFD